MLTEGHDPQKGVVAKIIEWSVNNRFLVLLAALFIFVAGSLSLSKIPLDAIPDLSDTQVIVRTEWPGQAPQVIEDQVTYPLASQMLGLPKTKSVRGVSMFGTSFLYVVFEDDVDLYWARSRVLEALTQTASSLPAGAEAGLGPDATGVGWVFQYALYDASGGHDLQQLRSLQDWFVRYELLSVYGVSEVASVGGYVKEYQVLVDPKKLRAFDVSLTEVISAVRSANGETGGRTLEMGETEYLIRSLGYLQTSQDLEQAVIRANNGVPVKIGDIARVVEGPALRRGVTELNGQGEAVGGIVVMRSGANALQVIEQVKERLKAVQQGLPDGVELKVVYDRSKLISESVDYLKIKLIEECLMVVLISFVFLLHARSALVAVITLPLGILAAFVVMRAQGLSANIMSLGGIAIAIGAMVDAAIVMVENAHRKLASLPAQASAADKKQALITAAKEVGPGLFFSLLIITVSFFPVFALTGQSARLFAPLAFTKTYAMAAASVLSVTLVPVLMLLLVRGRIRSEDSNPVNRFFVALYRPSLNAAIKYKKLTLGLCLAALLSTAIPIKQLGSEFMPPLYEGGILYMPMTLPGVSVTKAREILQVTNRQLMAIPEVVHAFGKAGRSDSATDPAPLLMIETWVELKPRSEWRADMTPEKLIREMDAAVGLPGMMNSWNYPIKTRLEMLTTGIRTPVGIKVSGPELEGIDDISRQVEAIAREVPGTRSAIADRVQGAKYVEIQPDRRALARYGVSLQHLQTVIQTALGGMALDQAIEGRERYPIMIRYDRPFREGLDDLSDILVSGADGLQVPLADVASIGIANGPAMIRSEDARLNGFVFVDIDNRDLGGYVAALQNRLGEIPLPPGYSFKLSGQFEQMQLASERLKITIPATLLIIVVLLYLYFGQWDRTLMILLSVPFGLIGGFWWLWLADYQLSVAVAVGFIALAGVAVETALVMLLFIDQRMREHPPENYSELVDNVRQGAVLRLRPKLMTVGTIVLGLTPIFMTEGPGTEIMRRIALPMLGGMLSTTVLTLILMPVLYILYFGRSLRKD
jgi:Cu(I)/Ag(I) efflux system membrane protein CusA/SilA